MARALRRRAKPSRSTPRHVAVPFHPLAPRRLPGWLADSPRPRRHSARTHRRVGSSYLDRPDARGTTRIGARGARDGFARLAPALRDPLCDQGQPRPRRHPDDGGLPGLCLRSNRGRHCRREADRGGSDPDGENEPRSIRHRPRRGALALWHAGESLSSRRV